MRLSGPRGPTSHHQLVVKNKPTVPVKGILPSGRPLPGRHRDLRSGRFFGRWKTLIRSFPTRVSPSRTEFTAQSYETLNVRGLGANQIMI